MDDHALGEEAGEGLGDRDAADAPQRAGEEARIEQVQDRMLDAADILVDGQPVIGRFAGQRRLPARRQR